MIGTPIIEKFLDTYLLCESNRNARYCDALKLGVPVQRWKKKEMP